MQRQSPQSFFLGTTSDSSLSTVNKHRAGVSDCVRYQMHILCDACAVRESREESDEGMLNTSTSRSYSEVSMSAERLWRNISFKKLACSKFRTAHKFGKSVSCSFTFDFAGRRWGTDSL